MKSQKKAPSAKKTRDLEKSRKEILGVAFIEVFNRGFQGVSVDDIVKKTSLTKGAFYHHFPTKLDLGYALVEEVISPMIIERWIQPLASYENPLDGILDQMKNLIGKANPDDFRLGCPLNNLVQEMSPIDDGFQQRLQKALNLWIDETEIYLKQAKKAGFLKKSVNTRQTAHFIVMAHEGIYGLLKGIRNPRSFDMMFEPIKQYFHSLQN